MAYSDKVTEVLKKYKILNPDGSLRKVNLQRSVSSDGRPLGPGPIVDEEVLNKLIDADKTKDKRWLDWIFYQAGGGNEYRDKGNAVLASIKQRVIDRLTEGYIDEKGTYHKPIPRDKAEELWNNNKDHYENYLSFADQDTIINFSNELFGFYRKWPGRGRIYEKIVNALDNFFKIQPKLVAANKKLAKDGNNIFPTEPEQFSSVEDLENVISNYEKYLVRKSLLKDIKVDVIYDDDNVTAIAPLTLAAAVRYGSEGFPVADQDTLFSVAVKGASPQTWKNYLSNNYAIVYLHFKVPMPAYVHEHELTTLQDVMVHIKNTNTMTFITKSHKLSLDDFIRIIEEEVEREEDVYKRRFFDDESDEIAGSVKDYDRPQRGALLPLFRGPNVFKSKEEAEQVINSIKKAVKAIHNWYNNKGYLKFNKLEKL